MPKDFPSAIDSLHKIATILIAALVLWMVSTIHQNNKDIATVLSAVTVLQATIMEMQKNFHSVDEMRIQLYSQHYNKEEVRGLVDRTIKPIYDKMDDTNRKLGVIENDIKELVRLTKTPAP